ncbi:hypothetical protein EVAR_97086_1 [Eumeta japonica]|uniref:Uncharacterized protein n=1 Tax=Eumeta variegata TaxID=151549 RepID=A0A4C1X697_EUMVA|nr:hypothetical protein EVAR_97086_1 [Eumeta japonica]
MTNKHLSGVFFQWRKSSVSAAVTKKARRVRDFIRSGGRGQRPGLKIPSREEASVVKAYLSRNEDIMENTLQVLYRQREAFKDTYELLRLWRP